MYLSDTKKSLENFRDVSSQITDGRARSRKSNGNWTLSLRTYNSPAIAVNCQWAALERDDAVSKVVPHHFVIVPGQDIEGAPATGVALESTRDKVFIACDFMFALASKLKSPKRRLNSPEVKHLPRLLTPPGSFAQVENTRRPPQSKLLSTTCSN